LSAKAMRAPWWTSRAIGLHVALAICLPTFFVLAWWQLHRALSGNLLSWAYTFEWPFFACYAIWMWWRLVHDESPVPGRKTGASSSVSVTALQQGFDPYNSKDDPELAAYNRYLAGLHAADKQKRG
jgi:hypothetical protein